MKSLGHLAHEKCHLHDVQPLSDFPLALKKIFCEMQNLIQASIASKSFEGLRAISLPVNNSNETERRDLTNRISFLVFKLDPCLKRIWD